MERRSVEIDFNLTEIKIETVKCAMHKIAPLIQVKDHCLLILSPLTSLYHSVAD
jgi:hypothetical protein